MTIDDIVELYIKEREYERAAFGEYRDIPSLSFPSFLIFLDCYVKKAMAAYSEKWESNLPEWLITCREFQENGTAPVKAYEEVIKIMALAGAILETYTNIDPSKWREDVETEIQKWKQ